MMILRTLQPLGEYVCIRVATVSSYYSLKVPIYIYIFNFIDVYMSVVTE